MGRQDGFVKKLLLYGMVVIVFIAFHGPSAWLAYFLQFPGHGPGGLNPVLLNVAIFAAWGGIHSVLSRHVTKDFMRHWMHDDFVKPVSVIIMGISQCFMLYYWQPLNGILWQTSGLAYWILTALFLSGFGLVFYASLLLDYMEVLGVRKILRRIKGEAAKPPELALKGPYRYCRHPVYIATIAALWIGPVMTYGRLEFVILGTVYIFIGTCLEEMTARAEIGDAYEAYQARVPMWIPRLVPRKDK